MTSSVFPTGTTVYNPDKCWNGYSIFQARDIGATLIDMNGNVVNQWKGLDGLPNKILPGGFVMGSSGMREPRYGNQDYLDLIQVSWDGEVVWKFNKYERIKDPYQKAGWIARQHHDYQREGNPVGYYVPGMDPLPNKGNTMILCHKNLNNPVISDKTLLDDTFVEVTWDGKIIWEWTCADHFDEMGFSEEAKNTMYRNPSVRGGGGNGVGDWNHINSLSLLGPNKWYDAGDQRFHPDNLIWSGRQTNIMAITDKKTGKLVWRLGPDYSSTPELRKLGQIVGQHHSHMIPKGLPGAGNILIYDNGGWAGYGLPNPGAPNGTRNALRDYSRILEIDPTTLEVVWKYTPTEAGYMQPIQSYRFYSGMISSAQRLPNGNTMITEGSNGRLFEVTSEHELVWEYVSPYFGKKNNLNMVYRAYRVPYEWVPQVDKPQETALLPIDNSKYVVPGSPKRKTPKVTKLKTSGKFSSATTFCVVSFAENKNNDR